jgi:hypothetical protein
MGRSRSGFATKSRDGRLRPVRRRTLTVPGGVSGGHVNPIIAEGPEGGRSDERQPVGPEPRFDDATQRWLDQEAEAVDRQLAHPKNKREGCAAKDAIDEAYEALFAHVRDTGNQLECRYFASHD